MTTLWADPGETDREYYDPDPHRHDVPDEICQCGHSEDDHTHTGGGCERLGCTCRWWAAADITDDWQEGWDDEYRT